MKVGIKLSNSSCSVSSSTQSASSKVFESKRLPLANRYTRNAINRPLTLYTLGGGGKNLKAVKAASKTSIQPFPSNLLFQKTAPFLLHVYDAFTVTIFAKRKKGDV